MPFALIIVGAVLLASAINDTSSQLGTLVKSDLTGPDNFVYWTVSILIIGGIGYVPTLRPLSRVFLLLVIVGLLLSNGNPNSGGGGFFNMFFADLNVNRSANLQTKSPQLTELIPLKKLR